MKQWNMPSMQSPGIPDTKKVDSYEKYCEFIPDDLHHLIFPKPEDETIKRIKDHRRHTANKRLDKIKMMKGEKCVFDDKDDDLSECDDDKVVDEVVDDTADVVDSQKIKVLTDITVGLNFMLL